MNFFVTVLEYRLQAVELYVYSTKEAAIEKANEIKKSKLDLMDILQRRYYRLYAAEVEEGKDCLNHYKVQL